MNDGNPSGEVRPMVDREQPNAAETRGARVGTRSGKASRVGSSHRCLACRSGTAHHRLSEIGNWGIPDEIASVAEPVRQRRPTVSRGHSISERW